MMKSYAFQALIFTNINKPRDAGIHHFLKRSLSFAANQYLQCLFHAEVAISCALFRNLELVEKAKSSSRFEHECFCMCILYPKDLFLL